MINHEGLYTTRPEFTINFFTKNQLCWGTSGCYGYDDNGPQQCILAYFSDLIDIQQAVISQENGAELDH